MLVILGLHTHKSKYIIYLYFILLSIYIYLYIYLIHVLADIFGQKYINMDYLHTQK